MNVSEYNMSIAIYEILPSACAIFCRLLGDILNEKISSPFLHLFGAFLMRFFGAQAFSALSLILSI